MRNSKYDYLSIDRTSIFSHAAPHHHLLTECVSSPYFGLPEPLWVLQLQNPGTGRVPHGTGRRRKDPSKRGSAWMHGSTFHVRGAPGRGTGRDTLAPAKPRGNETPEPKAPAKDFRPSTKESSLEMQGTLMQDWDIFENWALLEEMDAFGK